MKLIALAGAIVSMSLSSLSIAAADVVRMDGNVRVTMSDSPHQRFAKGPFDWSALMRRRAEKAATEVKADK